MLCRSTVVVAMLTAASMLVVSRWSQEHYLLYFKYISVCRKLDLLHKLMRDDSSILDTVVAAQCLL
jgi:hypothetical protein